MPNYERNKLTDKEISKRVGFMTTSLLEDEVRDYIAVHTCQDSRGKSIYTGEACMLDKLGELVEYNAEPEEK